jgi:hypothetical protein
VGPAAAIVGRNAKQPVKVAARKYDTFDSFCNNKASLSGGLAVIC